MTPSSRWARAWAAVDARLVLHNFLYEVPAYANTLPYLLGAVTLAGVVILVATGVLLGQFYAPDPGVANQSIRIIMTQVWGGETLRGIHVWASHLTAVVLLLHLLRVYVTGAYRFPREANWIVGVALLGTVLALFFTGIVLRWDQEGVEAIAHNVAFARFLGVFGAWFSPAFSSHVPLLTRLYMAHVGLLPLLVFILLSMHVYLVRQHGFSAPLGPPETTPAHFTFAHHLKRATGYGSIMFGLALALAVILPPGEGPAPVPGIEVTKPPWVFLPAYGLENVFGLAGLWGVVAVFLWLLVVPILDRGQVPGWRGRRRALAAGAAVAGTAIALGVYAWLWYPVPHLH